MKQHYTIGILSPLLDGYYYGGLIAGVHRVLQQHDAQLIAIQTMDEYEMEASFDCPLAWDHVDGWIVVMNAVNDSYLDKISHSGKPLISIAQIQDKIECPSVLCDNVQSMSSAVKHLIDHGHRDIAFVGCMEQLDIRERFQGYCSALSEKGIAYNPDLFFAADDNLADAGRNAAKNILNAGVPCTAIAAATDMNAIGIMEVLQEAGCRIPEHIAVVGFDDADAAKYVRPLLTTVHQPIDELGSRAAELLLKKLSGADIPNAPAYIKTNLILRQSCGCNAHVNISSPEQPDNAPDAYSVRNYMESIITNRHRVSINLLKSTSNPSKDMSWLRWTNHHWGCIALWNQKAKPQQELIVDRAYSTTEETLPPAGTRYPVEAFPPLEYFPHTTHSGGKDMIIIQSLQTESRKFGVGVFVIPVNMMLLMGYDTRQLSTLIGVAFEREALYAELSLRENTYRTISERLEVVSRTTNDGIWEWNLDTNQIELSDRLQRILGTSKRKSMELNDFRNLVHTDDLRQVQRKWKIHLENKKPYQIEFRMRRSDGEYLWVFAAGEALYTEQGVPYKMIGAITDITKRKKAEEQIYYLAYHDALTGLSNRSLFHDKLLKAIEKSKESGRSLAVMIVDLDRFKLINDSLGHQTGDQLLQFVAQQIMRHVREEDTVARLGGDEFIVLLPNIHNKGIALTIAETIQHALKKPFVLGQQELTVTSSIGVSLYPSDGQDPETLMRSADLAMYRAKYLGRDQTEMFAP